jgi:hypothetical protein
MFFFSLDFKGTMGQQEMLKRRVGTLGWMPSAKKRKRIKKSKNKIK